MWHSSVAAVSQATAASTPLSRPAVPVPVPVQQQAEPLDASNVLLFAVCRTSFDVDK